MQLPTSLPTIKDAWFMLSKPSYPTHPNAILETLISLCCDSTSGRPNITGQQATTGALGKFDASDKKLPPEGTKVARGAWLPSGGQHRFN
jgi:hypothetical protein